MEGKGTLAEACVAVCGHLSSLKKPTIVKRVSLEVYLKQLEFLQMMEAMQQESLNQVLYSCSLKQDFEEPLQLVFYKEDEIKQENKIILARSKQWKERRLKYHDQSCN